MRILLIGGPKFVGRALIDAALAAGLTCRPLAETVRDTLDWVQREPRPQPLQAGLPPAREAELLAAWMG